MKDVSSCNTAQCHQHNNGGHRGAVKRTGKGSFIHEFSSLKTTFPAKLEINVISLILLASSIQSHQHVRHNFLVMVRPFLFVVAAFFNL